jgi:Protein of unknown function (DUF3667)
MSRAATCVTCGAPETGRYCSNCGERLAGERDYSILRFLESLAESLFHLDGRFARTFRLLLSRPGALADDFLKGRRKPFMGPVQCFLVANLVYFLVQPFTGFETFTTTLELHTSARPWSALASRMTSDKLAATGLPLEAFAERFDATTDLQAHTLLILMVPMFALVLMAAFGRSRKFFAEHLVLAFYTYAFILICLTFASLISNLAFRAAIALTGKAYTAVYVNGSTALIVLPVALYLYFACRRFYRESIAATVSKAAALTASLVGVVTAYRFVLFFTAFYWT